jgi:hypothetical protein
MRGHAWSRTDTPRVERGDGPAGLTGGFAADYRSWWISLLPGPPVNMPVSRPPYSTSSPPLSWILSAPRPP